MASNVLHTEGSVEVLAQITTDILLEHKSTSRVMEVILGQVNN